MPERHPESKNTDQLAKRIEMAANLGILLIVLATSTLVVRRWVINRGRASDHRIAAGRQLDLPGLKIPARRQAILLILSTECRFCTQSMPFYRSLSSERGRRGYLLFAAFREPSHVAAAYLRTHGLAVDGITRASASDLSGSVTPTVVLVDEKKCVVESWVGQLLPAAEATVRQRARGHGPGAETAACPSGDCLP
jgi:hypothetical protein